MDKTTEKFLPDIMYLKITYELSDGKLDRTLDEELKKYITERFELEYDGKGYDFEDKERSIYFYKKFINQ